MLQAINRVASYLPAKTQCMFLSGDSRAVDADLLYFTYTHSRSSQKLTSSTVTRIEIERNLMTLGCRKSLLWNAYFQNLRLLHVFARHYSKIKINFSKRFSKDFKRQNDFK